MNFLKGSKISEGQIATKPKSYLSAGLAAARYNVEISWVKLIFVAFFVFPPFVLTFGQCDSFPVLETDSWVYDIQYITSDFIHEEKCKLLSENQYEFEEDCSPCTLATTIEGHTEAFYMSVAGVTRSEVYMNGQEVEPVEQFSDISYFYISPTMQGANLLKVTVWLSNEIHMEISGFDQAFDFESFLTKKLETYEKHSLVTNLFLGLLFAAFMISLSSFIFSRSADFKWYTLYVFVLFLFFLPRGIHSNEILGLENKDVQMIFQPLVYVFYNLFIISFLKITKRQYLLNFLLKAAMVMLLAFSCLFIISIGFDLDDFKKVLWTIFRLVALIYASLTIGFLVATKIHLKIFIVIGSISLIVGAGLAMYFTHISFNPFGILPIHWMYYGTLVEVLVFYSGIGYRINLEHIEKLELSQSLFDEMEKNKILQEQKNAELVKEVSLAEGKVKEEEKQRTKAEYELLLRKTELQLLRAQMNPHFIYNSLNSIKSYIARNEPRKATNFLNKFAKLIRIILNNSNSSLSSLKQELETLRFYLEVEQLRLDDDFTFNIEMEEHLGKISIPPLLIQPYVENAIWHGLVPKKGPKVLLIKVEEVKENRLKITIKDNGIGRIESMEYKSKVLHKNDSRGMDITSTRILKGVGKSSFKNKVEVIDHYNKNGDSLGTEVVILINYHANDVLEGEYWK
jgi:sensor histidine kinase YesM